MIKDNALGDRLNAVKKGQPIPEPPMQPQSVSLPSAEPKITLKSFLISKILNISEILLTSLLYGYGIRTILNLDWNLFGALSVGFLLNHSISIFPKMLFPKLFKKSK